MDKIYVYNLGLSFWIKIFFGWKKRVFKVCLMNFFFDLMINVVYIRFKKVNLLIGDLNMFLKLIDRKFWFFNEIIFLDRNIKILC